MLHLHYAQLQLTNRCRYLQALLLGHPAKAIRDTARYPPLMLPRRPGGKARPRALRALAAEQLGLTIQVCCRTPPEHSDDPIKPLCGDAPCERLQRSSWASAPRYAAELRKNIQMIL